MDKSSNEEKGGSKVTPQGSKLSELVAVSGQVMPNVSFFTTFGTYGIALAAVLPIVILWTMWLIALAVAPEYVMNSLTGTAVYDEGEFWPIVGQPLELAILTTIGFAFSLLFYLYTLFLLARRKPLQIFLKVVDSLVKLCRLERDSSSVAPIDHNSSNTYKIIQNWKALTGYNGEYRRIWNFMLKLIDIALGYMSLLQMRENGAYEEIIYACSTLVAANCMSYALVILYSRYHSTITEAIIDALFDMMMAVGIPLANLLLCHTRLELDHDLLTLGVNTLPAGTFERVARLRANPIQIAQFVLSFNSLRILSLYDGFIKISLNLSFSYRIKRLAELLIERVASREKQQTKMSEDQRRIPRPVSMFFICFAMLLPYLSHNSILASKSLCAEYPECAVYAYPWFSRNSCPCTALVDVVNPPTYDQWVEQEDVTETVRQLSKAGFLQILFLVNRGLEELPRELESCRDLHQLYLLYTNLRDIPDWAGVFTNLNAIHLEGRVDQVSLVRIADNFFDDMASLTYVHIGIQPMLMKLPRLDGLVNLQRLELSDIDNVEYLPSMETLEELEVLSLVGMDRLQHLPQLTSNVALRHLSIFMPTPLCCNGYMSECDLTHPYCAGNRQLGYAPTSCLDESLKATNATMEVLNNHAGNICGTYMGTKWTLPITQEERFARQCEGKLYRECSYHTVVGNETKTFYGMCLNTRMMVVACTSTPYLINYRKAQIATGVGDACDPVEEAWLGCSAG